MRASTIFLLAASAALAGAGAARAQVPVRLHVTPFAGGALHLGKLPTPMLLSLDARETDQVVNARLENAAAFGGIVGVRIGKHFAVEGTVSYVPGKVTADGLPGFDARILSYTGGLAYYLPAPMRLEPFVNAGAGVKTYDFDRTPADRETDLVGSFGAGTNLTLTRALALRIEGRDQVSSFNSKLGGVDNTIQHDLLLTGGLTFKLGKAGPAATVVQAPPR